VIADVKIKMPNKWQIPKSDSEIGDPELVSGQGSE
jgi:hypothetical protein